MTKDEIEEQLDNHKHIEFICRRWYEQAKVERQNTSAFDYMHGLWIGCANQLPVNYDTLKMINYWQDKCHARMGTLPDWVEPTDEDSDDE